MPSYIVKPERDVDFYINWSTIVDAPLSWGTRAEVEASRVESPADRFERADATGTSSFDGFFGWDETEFDVENTGPKGVIVDRSNLRAFCLSLDPWDNSVFDESLTRPRFWEVDDA